MPRAQEYVDDGEWGDRTETQWVEVYVQRDLSFIEDRLVDLIGEHDWTRDTDG